MKKLILSAILITTLFSCTPEEIVKEVPVEVIKEVPVEVIKEVPVNTLLKTAQWIETHENGVGRERVYLNLKEDIDLNSFKKEKDYDSFSIYIGNNRPDKNATTYASKNTVTIVFFSKNHSKEVKVYKVYERVISHSGTLNEDLFIQNDYIFADDFFKNEFIGSMTRADFYKL